MLLRNKSNEFISQHLCRVLEDLGGECYAVLLWPFFVSNIFRANKWAAQTSNDQKRSLFSNCLQAFFWLLNLGSNNSSACSYALQTRLCLPVRTLQNFLLHCALRLSTRDWYSVFYLTPNQINVLESSTAPVCQIWITQPTQVFLSNWRDTNLDILRVSDFDDSFSSLPLAHSQFFSLLSFVHRLFKCPFHSKIHLSSACDWVSFLSLANTNIHTLLSWVSNFHHFAFRL